MVLIQTSAHPFRIQLGVRLRRAGMPVHREASLVALNPLLQPPELRRGLRFSVVHHPHTRLEVSTQHFAASLRATAHAAELPLSQVLVFIRDDACAPSYTVRPHRHEPCLGIAVVQVRQAQRYPDNPTAIHVREFRAMPAAPAGYACGVVPLLEHHLQRPVLENVQHVFVHAAPRRENKGHEGCPGDHMLGNR